MIWWRAAAGLLGAGLVLIGLSTLDDPWVTLVDQRPVAIATLPCASANQSQSSGFVIDDRTVVTVAHAIHESRDVALRDAFGRWHRPEVVRLDLESDLAVLHVEGLRATTFDRAPRRPTDDWMQTSATMLGGAASGTLDADILRRVRIVTEVVGNRAETSERSGFEVALDIAPGDSGAALVDDDDALIGLVFARSTRRDAVTWATAADEIDVAPNELPTWECGPAFGAELELRASTPSRLAG